MNFSINIAAQIVGAMGIIVWVLGIRQTKMKKIALFQMIANGLYGIEYLILTAFSAAGMNGLSFIRCFITYEYVKRKKNPPKYILIIFSFLVLLVGVVAYNGIVTIIPIVITLTYVYSIWQQNVKVTYILILATACLWIVYNIYVGSYVGVIGNIFEIVFSAKSIKNYNEELERKKQLELQKAEELKKRLEQQEKLKQKKVVKSTPKSKNTNKKKSAQKKKTTNKKNNKGKKK